MEKIREIEDVYWEELTSYPEILRSLPMNGWGEGKSYNRASIPRWNDVVQEVEKIIGQPVIFVESQNLNLSQVEKYVLYLARCRCDRLGEDEALLFGKKLNESSSYKRKLRRGDIYVSPDGKKFIVTGREGDPFTTSSIKFVLVTDEGVKK